MGKRMILLFFLVSLVSFSEDTFEIEKRREEQTEFEKQVRENPFQAKEKEIEGIYYHSGSSRLRKVRL